ncbi:conserved hypothetical protein [Leishmania braziliensis MHOM/BR/75/M2904]|uniref:Exonuclease domain-containing protein n=2 Tax=Leishmania braziliensis TaxID=5660 RepID=A4H610_LEIBR|nr:conserved hypothetical protein [Leishmania braziliensis MHOM/BR/75/M2904]CAM37231.1 conserved hypothetical protein [Leishmania braziliensis MHOM/BR/75/M2904]
MPSISLQGSHSAALDGEGPHLAHRRRPSSSAPSSASSRSSSQGRPSSVHCASSPLATPVIVGATSSELRNGEKKSRHKKARQGEDATREITCPPPPAPQQRQPHELSRGTTAPTPLQQRFSEVELQFQLEQDRAQRSALAPHDIANLILWSVPAPVPIIESPRVFFIKNKSHVRNAVVIYVNGWSYDEMLCTGVGLPRTRGEAHHRSAPQEQATPPHSTATNDSTTGHAVESTATAANAKDDDDSTAHWDKELCSAMLRPVREGRCWARQSRGAGCAGGVQYCPLFIPSTRNELEKDLWWRNDALGRLRSSSAASSSAVNRFHPNFRRGGEERDGSAVHCASPAVRDARGVGTMFQQALQAHAKKSGTADGAASGDISVMAASPPAAASPTFASDAFQQYQHLWANRDLLQQYALHLPEHTAELHELGFTLAPPPESTAAAPAADEETALQGGNGVGGAQDSWVSFPAPSTTATADATAATGRGVRVVAFDCEMVQIEGGESALARATLVDVLTGSVVLDLLVKPRQRITDYRTRFSGIDAAMLEPVSTTLADCQQALQRLVDTQTFVVGHSLENDFKACKCIPNCYVLDTTRLFPHPAGLPYKNALRFLAQRYLQRRIQQGPHNSATDAVVSAELTQLKLINGPSFGVRPRVSVLGCITEADPNVQIYLFDDAVTLTSLLPAPQSNASSATYGETSGGTVPSAPPSSAASSGRIDAVPVRHDEDAMRKAVRALQRRVSQQAHEAAAVANGTDGDKAAPHRPSFSLFWVQLTQAKVDVTLPPAQPSAPFPAVAAGEESETGEKTPFAGVFRSCDTSSARMVAQFRRVHDTNRRVLQIIEACPDETIIVVLTGRCDGEAGGNHFSRAQGTCFAFVKDRSAPGPRADELTKLTDESSGSALPRESAAAVPHHVDVKTAMIDSTPRACQQQ